jgi:hypothetical protein
MGTVTVRFEFKSENNGIKRFEVVSGTMEWSGYGTVYPPAGPCQYQFGPIDVPVVPLTGNRLSIDTTTTPATYTGFGQTQGDEIRLAEECEDGAFSTRPRQIWFSTGDTENLVSPDGNSITGSNASSTSDWQWTFTRK